MYIGHPHLIHYDIRDKTDLFVHMAVKTLGLQLLGVFLPVLLYFEIGLTFSEIFLFFGMWSLGICLSVYFIAAKLVSTRGTKVGMFLGMPMLICLFLGLNLLEAYPGLLYIIPWCGSLYTSLFRMGFHTDLSQEATSKKFGSKVALLNIVITIVGAIIPTFGGYLLDIYPLSTTIYLGSALLLLSLVPLLHTSKYHESQPFSNEKLLEMSQESIGVSAIATFAGETYVKFVGSTIRPLIVFIFLESYTKVGILTTVATILVVVVLYVAGKFSDMHQEEKIMPRNISIQASNWITALGLFATALLSSLTIGLIDVFHRITTQLNSTLINKVMYEYANETGSNPVYVTALHEMACHGSKSLICFLFAGIFAFLGNDPWFLVIPLGLMVLCIPLQMIFFRKKHFTPVS